MGSNGHMIVDTGGKRASLHEEAAEISFDEETDFLIRGMVAKAYMSGEYEFAVSILLLEPDGEALTPERRQRNILQKHDDLP